MNKSLTDALKAVRNPANASYDWERIALELETHCRRLLDVAATAADFVWETDDQMRLTGGMPLAVSSGLGGTQAYIGKTTTELLGRDAASDPVFAAHLDDLAQRRPFREFEYSTALPDGSVAWSESNGNPVFGEDGSFLGFRGTCRNISKRKENEMLIARMANHDSLTDLPNRVYFRQCLNEALHRAQAGETISVLCLDLDRFKLVNDLLGHDTGDRLLKLVAERLRDVLGGRAVVARLGSDEFAILAESLSGPAQVSILAEEIIDLIGIPFDLDGHQMAVICSAGIALAPSDGQTADELMKHADIALGRAKSEAAGSWSFFDTGMAASLVAKQQLELDLRVALENHQFELLYQPLYNIKSREITAFEALIRWRHPLRGLVGPDEFIPLAEQNGLIIPIGEWVVRQACAEAAKWPRGVNIAVNLSPAQFKSRNLVSAVRHALDASGLQGARLELEITEAVLMLNSEATLAVLHEFRDAGVRISMDDFGTGYSSLSYLRSFPFDKIKIDRSFISDLTETAGASAIVRAIAGLGASMSLITTAEGVETCEQLAIVREEGCTEVQGYLFSKPVPPSEIPALLTRSSDSAMSESDFFSRFPWKYTVSPQLIRSCTPAETPLDSLLV